MGKIFPPTLAEWHSAVVGFYVGFVYGATHDHEVAAAGVKRVLGDDDVTGHLSDTREEAAYAGGCFMIGLVVGTRWDRARAAAELAQEGDRPVSPTRHGEPSTSGAREGSHPDSTAGDGDHSDPDPDGAE